MFDSIPATLAMWEFSWLVRREAPEGEYADWERILDEAAERGYDVLRIDAFPHLIADDRQGRAADRFSIVPQPRAFMWGNHRLVEVSPRQALSDFIGKASERGIKIGLSSWFLDDLTHRCEEVLLPDDYARIWHETLDFLAAEGHHGSIAWVDLCNEFPLGDWARGAHLEIFGASWRDPSVALGIWTPEQVEKINSYFRAIDHLKADWPDLDYTYSLATLPPNAAALDLTAFDLIEAHIWISTTNPEFVDRTRFIDFLTNLPDAVSRHVALVDEVYWGEREKWLKALRFAISTWADLARSKGLPLINTEGWASTVYENHPTPSGRDPWIYVEDVGREAVETAVECGYSGICTSNFSQPHFPGLWQDCDWHRQLNDQIHKAAR